MGAPQPNARQRHIVARERNFALNRDVLELECGHTQVQAPRKVPRTRAVCHACMDAVRG